MLSVTAVNVSRHESEAWERRSHSVLGRAAIVLDAFGGSRLVLSLSELSDIACLPKSTVHRFAEQLVELGWLERSTEGYRVGMRLFEVGSLAYRRNRLRDAAVPYMQQLSASTGCAVHLGVLDRGEVLYLHTVPVRRLHLPTREGGRMPAYCTGLGKALLAFAREETVEAAMVGGLPRRTPATIVSPDVLRRELTTVEAGGVAFDRQEACRGVSCVAAPIRSSGWAIGAVSITGRTQDIDVRRHARVVRAAADGIWQDLFFRRESAPSVSDEGVWTAEPSRELEQTSGSH